MPHTVGYRLISACTVMVSSTSPVSVVSMPSLASTAACSPSGQRCSVRDPAARGVDQLHGAVADDVVHVALQQDVRVQRDVDLGQRGADVFLGVEVDAAERRLELAGARRR